MDKVRGMAAEVPDTGIHTEQAEGYLAETASCVIHTLVEAESTLMR